MSVKSIGSGDIIQLPAGSSSEVLGVIVRDASSNAVPKHPVLFEAHSNGCVFTDAAGRRAQTVHTDANGEAWARIQNIPGGPQLFNVTADAGTHGQQTFSIEVVAAMPFNHGGVAPSPPAPRPSLWPIAVMVLAFLVVGGIVAIAWKAMSQPAAARTPTVITVPSPSPAPTTGNDPAARAAIGRLEQDVDVFEKDTKNALKHKPDRHEVEADARERFRHLHHETYAGLNGLAHLARVTDADNGVYAELCRAHPDLPRCIH